MAKKPVNSENKEIQQAQILIINDYRKKISSLQATINRYENLIHELSSEIGDLPVTILQRVVNNDYDKSWDYYNKIHYILSNRRQCLFVSEIVDAIRELEPERKEMDKEVTRKPLSGSVSNYIKQGKFKNYVLDGKHVIGLPEWFDGEVPKPEYDKKRIPKHGGLGILNL
jgi:hypothetical protein